jgi:two-component system, chemotaxis family, chemotaxis protein CheY
MQTILIVDDSPTMRQMVSFCLRGAGYTVIEAVDGQDALTKLSGSRVDLLVTDLYMPRIDGLELSKRVRAMPPYRFTPILVLTTEAQTSRKAEGQAAGVTGWFVKPFEPAQLLKVVKRVLA